MAIDARQRSDAVATRVKLLLASQPDIVRSTEKDELYLQQVVEACHEAVRRLVGPFRALQYAKESKLVATLVYYGLTTGVGVQTLGEEYCNTMQVTGLGHLPRLPQRAALVLLQTLSPYLSESLAVQLDRSAEQDDSNDGASALGGAVDSGGGTWGSEASTSPGGAHDGNRHPDASGSNLGGIVRQAVAEVKLRGRQLRSYLASNWVAIRPGLSSAGRLHLALFYCYGAYYLLSHRLVGVRYVSIAQPLQQRASYRALGLMLMLQLGVSALMQAHTSVALLRRQRQQAAGKIGPDGATSLHATVLDDWDEDGNTDIGSDSTAGQQGSTSRGFEPHAVRSALKQEGGSGGHLDEDERSPALAGPQQAVPSTSRQQCPLCLSVRTTPTSTPCGHLFCWACIAQWCSEKAECPLCRARVVQTQLVRVYHSSF